MIAQPSFAVEPWSLRETELDLDLLAQTESVFALANGHIGLRGNLDEGEPNGLPGTYLNSFYELRPLPYAEGGYGYPESGQTLVNVTDGKIVRLLVDDEPFDVRYGKLLSHERELDFRAGVLVRQVDWRSPANAAVRVRSTRLVSFSQRAVAAVQYEVEPLDGPLRVVVQSELLANEPGAAPPKTDPRAAAVLESPLRSEEFFDRASRRGAASFDEAQRAPDGRRHGPHRRGPRRHRLVRGVQPRRRPGDRRGRPRGGRPPPRREVPGVRLVEPGAASRQSATRSSRRSPRRGTPAGTACSRPSARTSTTSGIAPTSSSRATSSFSRPCASRSSTRSRPEPAPSSARSPPRA